MEKSTLIGVFGGIAAVGVGMALKGADPHAGGRGAHRGPACGAFRRSASQRRDLLLPLQ